MAKEYDFPDQMADIQSLAKRMYESDLIKSHAIQISTLSGPDYDHGGTIERESRRPSKMRVCVRVDPSTTDDVVQKMQEEFPEVYIFPIIRDLLSESPLYKLNFRR